jgi:hypothetical protein
MVEAKESMSWGGRLSTQKKPMSSRALRATLFPEPERPVMMAMVGFTGKTGAWFPLGGYCAGSMSPKSPSFLL